METVNDVTPGGSNIFEDLGFPPEEARELLEKSRARIQSELNILSEAREALNIMRDTPAGMIPCEGGDFVRLEEAARYFQWHSFNRVLALLQTYEKDHVPRKVLFEEIMAMRPVIPK